jgi:hypothetical protein
MLLEDIMILLLIGSGIFLVGVPFYKIVKAVVPATRKDPVKDARERLERARLELEAAKVNKETEKLYDDLYSEITEDNTENRRKL